MYMNNALYQQDLDRVLGVDLSHLKGKNFFITGQSLMIFACWRKPLSGV